MQYIWRRTPRIALSRDASAWDFFQIWHLASHTGNLPTPGNLSRGGLLSFSNFWQVAKISWHAANSSPSDPSRSWIVPHMAPVTKIGPEKAYFRGFFTLTFDLWPRFCKNQHAIPKTHHHAKIHVRRSNGCSRRGCDGRKEGRKARKYIRMIRGSLLWSGLSIISWLPGHGSPIQKWSVLVNKIPPFPWTFAVI